MFYAGEKDPSNEVIDADVFAIVRNGGKPSELIPVIREHFKGNVSDIQLQASIARLNKM